MSKSPISISKSFWIKKIILAKVLKGKNVECPICTKKFITFLPFGSKIKRANALCIRCLSLERHRLIWLYLTQETDLFQRTAPTNLLHVAPEYCFFKLLKNDKSINYFPVDKFEEGYAYPSGTKNMDITNITEKDNHFDVILCNHVLEHIPDDHKAMSELFRVMKIGGWAILQVPIDDELEVTFEDDTIISPEAREEAFGQVDHVRQYGRDYKDRLTAVGFDVSPITYTESFSKKEKFRYGLPKYRNIYLCRKTGS
ncbi:MAG: SAM-dependent methyltransferase [Glaciecola sp.]|jgi:SAM-dependent methyltransferase